MRLYMIDSHSSFFIMTLSLYNDITLLHIHPSSFNLTPAHLVMQYLSVALKANPYSSLHQQAPYYPH